MTTTNQANRVITAERKWTCKNCPSKKYVIDGASCLLLDKPVADIIRLNDGNCPDKNW